MLGHWKLWIDCLKLGYEAQHVIAMRVAKIAAGGRGVDDECRQMVSEKIAAAVRAQRAATAALAAGKSIDAAASLALAPVQQTVRGNRRRLSRAKRLDDITLAVRRLVDRAGLTIRKVIE